MRTVDPQEWFFHQNFTLPLAKQACILAMIAVVAKNIFGADYILRVAVVLASGFVLSKLVRGVDPALVDAVRARRL